MIDPASVLAQADRVCRCYWQGEAKTRLSLRTEMTELRLMLEQYHKETARAETARLERKHD